MDGTFLGRARGRWLRGLFCLALLLALAGGCAGTGRAEDETHALNSSGLPNRQLSVDPIGKNEGFSAVLYDNRSGLATSEANAVAQTSEGFIWIGSYAGLIRYDGTTFERIDSTTDTAISSVRSLYVDSHDRLWIGTNDSGIFLMEKGELRNWGRAEGLESLSIRAIAEDEKGRFYFGSTAGIVMIDPEMKLSLLQDERIDEKTIRDLRRGEDGLVYGLSYGGDLFSIKDGEIVSFLSGDECRVKNVLSFLPDPENPGYMYLGTDESRVYYGNYENNFSLLGMKGVGSLTNVNHLEIIQGQVWICAGNGIGRLDGSGGFQSLKNIPMNSSVGHVMTDYEGNLWFTSTRQGVMKIVPNQFTDLFERYNLPQGVVNSTCMAGRQLFIGTEAGLIVMENGKRVDALPLTKAVTASGKKLGASDLLEYLDEVRIRCIMEDSKGRIWISTWRRRGLICYDHGEVTAFTSEDGLFSDQVRTTVELSDGSVAAANQGGVSIIRDGRVEASFGEKDGILVSDILTVAEGDGQELLLGSDGGGIYIAGSGEMRKIGIQEGLHSEIILRIRKSPSQGVFWIVTSNSLAYMTPDYQVTTIQHFPYSNNYDLYENSRGDIWVLSSNGIYVIPADELLANETIEPVFCGVLSGLPYVATANSFSEKTEDGELYIAGSLGVVKVNVENSFRNFNELKVSLPYIDADGERYFPDDSGSFTLPGNAHKLTIYPFVFNYSLIDPQISYRLENFDLTDVTVSRSDLDPISYTNLTVGAYDFVLKVKDPVRRSEQAVSFRIVKGKEISVDTVGTLLMIFASLLVMGRILIHVSIYRKGIRDRRQEKLFFGMILTNALMAVGESLPYLLDYIDLPFAGAIMKAGSTVRYINLVVFPYLLLIYSGCFTDTDAGYTRRTKLLLGIPCFLFTAAVLVNLRTGWLFTVNTENAYVHTLRNMLVLLPLLPVLFYLLLSLVRISRRSKRLTAMIVLLIAARLAGDVCCRNISSTSFVYTMILMCIHLSTENRPLYEEAL